MKMMRIIIGILSVFLLAAVCTGCNEKIGTPYTDRSWQQTPPGTGGGP
jgi:hypothetical protein